MCLQEVQLKGKHWRGVRSQKNKQVKMKYDGFLIFINICNASVQTVLDEESNRIFTNNLLWNLRKFEVTLKDLGWSKPNKLE